MDIKAALNKIADRKDLTGEEMRGVMRTIMAGEATPSQIGAFLMGMRIKGETVGEIAAAVSILREQMIPVEAPDDDLGRVAIVTVPVLPFARLDRTLDPDLRSLDDVLLDHGHDVLVEDDDGVPLSRLLPVAGELVLPCF